MKKTFSALILMLLALICASCSKGSKNTDGTTIADESSTGALLIAAGSTQAMALTSDWKIKNSDGKTDTVKAGWHKQVPNDAKAIDMPGASFTVGSYVPESWFYNRFKLDFVPEEGQRVLLELGGVCYKCEVYVNSELAGTHEGAYATFTIDITDYLKEHFANVLAIRVMSSNSGVTLDGLESGQLPIWNSAPKIEQTVYVYSKPAVYIDDVHVVPDCTSSDVSFTITVNNTTENEIEIPISASVKENNRSFALKTESTTYVAPAGKSETSIKVHLGSYQYWSPDNPFLYLAEVTVGTDTYSCKTGFKTLKVNKDGYFELNGKRILLKSAHMCNHIPGEIETTANLKVMYNLLLYMKSCGFNAIRFLQSPAYPQVLNMCDEIGLMVIQSHPYEWQKTASDRAMAEKYFELSVMDVLLRDRNHVSIAMFEMLNETEYSNTKRTIVDAAVKSLSYARPAAENMLFLFSSGRWDGNLSIGSASNPGSTTWDGYMGNESSEENDKFRQQSELYNAWSKGNGDIHYYPGLPYGEAVEYTFEQITDTDRAVFVSESGAGSIVNIISALQTVLQSKVRTGGTSIACLQQQIKQYRTFFDEYALDTVFATPEELFKASEEYMSKQRALILTMIRRNEKVNGISVTMANDVGFRGEGITETMGQTKRGTTDMLQEQLDDLRFCISLNNKAVYSGETIRLNIKISNYDVLSASTTYPVIVRISNNNGCIWSKEVKIKPEKLANGTVQVEIPVINESISTNGWKSGTYTIGVEMTDYAHPTCGVLEFTVTDKKLAEISAKVYTYNVSVDFKNNLKKLGAAVEDYNAGTNVGGATIFVNGTNILPTAAQALSDAARNGAHVVFLSAAALNSAKDKFSFADKGEIKNFYGWLYHNDSVVYGNSVTENMPNRCILDTDFYAPIYSNDYVVGANTPTDVSVISMFTGVDGGASSSDFSAGYQLATYAYGKGYVTITTLALEKGAGHPSSDLIISNLTRYKEPEYCKDRPHY